MTIEQIQLRFTQILHDQFGKYIMQDIPGNKALEVLKVLLNELGYKEELVDDPNIDSQPWIPEEEENERN